MKLTIEISETSDGYTWLGDSPKEQLAAMAAILAGQCLTILIQNSVENRGTFVRTLRWPENQGKVGYIMADDKE